MTGPPKLFWQLGKVIPRIGRRAGRVDNEKFIDALEGTTIDSPVGKLEVRSCDHQVVFPMRYSVTQKVPNYDFLMAADIITIPGKDYVPGCDDVAKSRK